MRLRVLGGLAAELDGERVAIHGHRIRSLLAWLALHPGMHPRSEVAERLWPASDAERARASLRSAVFELRRDLGGAPGLVATRDRVGLVDVWVDAHAFDELAARGRLAEAVVLGDAELLSDMDDEWVYPAREEHRRRRAELHGGLAAGAERRGDRDAAVRHARRRIALDPYSEDAHRTLIELLAAMGARASALLAYDALRSMLRRELGITPDRYTRALVERVLSDDEAVEDVPRRLRRYNVAARTSRWVGAASACASRPASVSWAQMPRLS